MSFLIPLAASAATAIGGSLFSSAFGDHRSATQPLQQFMPPGINNAGGITSTFGGQNFTASASPERQALVNNIANTFSGLADTTAGLRSRVAPGVSDLRAARLAEIENARTSAIGNLRENLQRRRVLGSSFGADAVSRTEAQFAQQKQQAQAESFLQELQMTNDLVQQEFTARRAAFQTGLDELNLEAQIATSLAGKATDILGKNAQTEAQLIALNQQGTGKFFGQFVAPGIQQGVTSLFSGGGAGASPGGFGTSSLFASGAI